MAHLPRFLVTSLLLLAGSGFRAQAQQGGFPREEGGRLLKKEGRVNASALREDERAERTRTVRADGRMAKKPRFIREEDRLDHRPHSRRAFIPPPPTRTRRHTTIKG